MIWVLVAVVVVLVVVIGVLVARERRSRRLREGFGPEYRRLAAERGDQRTAENELAQRRDRHEQFKVRELEPARRQQYLDLWSRIQRRFVDEPSVAVGQADRLVSAVMHDRGYPVDEDFEQRAADVSVDHPIVIENYRAARAISLRAQRSQTTTEDLHEAMVHFRSLFHELLDPDDDASSGESRPRDTRRSSKTNKEMTSDAVQR